MVPSRTLSQKKWENHLIREDDEAALVIEQAISLSDGRYFNFELNELHRHRLINGLDDISETFQFADEIEQFEKKAYASPAAAA